MSTTNRTAASQAADRCAGDPGQSLAGRCRHAQDIRKSRFLAQAAPVDTPEQALAFVQQVSDPAATHNCWAYRTGPAYRFNDDGEPGGTAGRPILQAIEGQGIDRAVVVVTRWYGGIKLGAGGLARAYGGTAAECLRLAERVPIVPMATLALSCDFAELALLKARLAEWGAAITAETFTATGADLLIHLPQAQADEVQARIGDITRGRSDALRVG
ncbi:IMPACT family protein [Dyella sp. KRB-257]|uniref:IMPACT family protein n=1 Tax=Dyella sp. KRB-257 TaxID=3400915 RepID=UPI003C0815BA